MWIKWIIKYLIFFWEPKFYPNREQYLLNSANDSWIFFKQWTLFFKLTEYVHETRKCLIAKVYFYALSLFLLATRVSTYFL